MNCFNIVLLLLEGLIVDQHAGVAEHVEHYPLTQSQITCKNAQHTANFCKIATERRGGTQRYGMKDGF